MSFIADMFACFAGEGVLAMKVVYGVSRPFTSLVSASRVVFADWVLAVATTSFFFPEMIIFLSLKNF